MDIILYETEKNAVWKLFDLSLSYAQLVADLLTVLEGSKKRVFLYVDNEKCE